MGSQRVGHDWVASLSFSLLVSKNTLMEVWSLDRADPLEEYQGNPLVLQYSGVLQNPLQYSCLGHRVGHDWAVEQLRTYTYIYTQKSEFTKWKLRKWFLFVAQSCKRSTARRRAFLAKEGTDVEGKVEEKSRSFLVLHLLLVKTSCKYSLHVTIVGGN